MKNRKLNLCRSILVVEDDEDVRELVTESLLAEGYDVQSAVNGADGLRKLQKMTAPTLIFLDLMMPSMNGWEFLDAQKKDPKLSVHKVVTISSMRPTASLQDPTPLKTAGALAKPLSLERIWNTVNEYCEAPATNRATA